MCVCLRRLPAACAAITLCLLAGVGGLGIPALQGAARAPVAQRLRNLVELPPLSVQFSLQLDQRRGWFFGEDRLMAQREIERLRERLEGSREDAATEVRLALLFELKGDRKTAQSMLQHARTAYETQGAPDSREDKLAAAYAEVLRLLGQTEEAESRLRRTLKTVPEAWRCRLILGRVLIQQATKLVGDAAREGAPKSAGASAGRLKNLAAGRVGAAGAARIRRLLAEAKTLGDEAVKLAPDEVESRLGRARLTIGAALTDTLMRRPPKEALRKELTRAMFSEDAFEDLRAATRLAPDNPRWAAISIWSELLAHSLAAGGLREPFFPGNLEWNRLPDDLRDRVRRTLGRMEELAERAQPEVASQAWDLSGSLLLFVMDDSHRGEAVLRRAVKADPHNEAAWQRLILGLVQAKRFEAMVEVCEQHLKVADTPRNRVSLAKAYDRLGERVETRTVLENARSQHPNDPLICLSLCAAIMRDPDATVFPKAALLLQTASQHLGKQPPIELVRNLVFQQAVFLALAGRPDQSRELFGKLRDIDADNPRIDKALKLLDELPPGVHR